MENKANTIQVELQPLGKRVTIQQGETLLDAAQAAGAGLISLCGGQGTCDSCRVKVTAGEINTPTTAETTTIPEQDLAAGYRLACQTTPSSNSQILIPVESLSKPQRLQTEGEEMDVPLAPPVRGVDVKMAPPSADDPQADTQRLRHALAQHGVANVRIRPPLLYYLADDLRRFGWHTRLILNEDEVIAARPPETQYYGLAADIGTTKLALYLLDLQTGKTLSKMGRMNPQIDYGEDVLSRIAYANQHQDGRKHLQRTLINRLNDMIHTLCRDQDIPPGNIVDGVFVGNTAMHHLFSGLPVEQLAFAPYVPAVNENLDLRADDLGLDMAPGAYIHLLPIIAGYVGADHTAAILATSLWQKTAPTLLIDIGTNTEISLYHKGHIVSCSCASGPAFEGAHIKDGMRAAPGAIEHIRITGDTVQTYTIDDQPPVGICGSGILDAVAEMKTQGIIDDKGALQKSSPRIYDQDGQTVYRLVSAPETGHGADITISRKDINEIQLAKAAIRAGLEALLSEENLSAQEIGHVLIAGAFGSYIDIDNAIRIGMFPDLPCDRFQQIGNAAGVGAKMSLLSRPHRGEIQNIASSIDYLELTTYARFQETFMEAMFLRQEVADEPEQR